MPQISFRFVLNYKNLSLKHKTFLTNLSTILIPKTLFDIIVEKDRKFAMKVEMEALRKKKKNIGVGEIAKWKKTYMV